MYFVKGRAGGWWQRAEERESVAMHDIAGTSYSARRIIVYKRTFQLCANTSTAVWKEREESSPLSVAHDDENALQHTAAQPCCCTTVSYRQILEVVLRCITQTLTFGIAVPAVVRQVEIMRTLLVYASFVSLYYGVW